MNKKGFTLIELLAVIVILAIIALIATPIVLNIISDTDEQADLRSADFYLDAVELSIAQAVLDGENLADGNYTIKDGNICRNTDCTDSLIVEVKGKVPETGTIMITNGQISGVEIVLNDKTIVKDDKGELKYYQQSQSIFGKFDSVCEYDTTAMIAEKAIGAKYECKVDPNKAPYTFYVLSYNKSDGSITKILSEAVSVNLIMDQNINSDGTPAEMRGISKNGDNVYNLEAWISWAYLEEHASQDDLDNYENLNIYGPITAMNYLEEATKTWTNATEIKTSEILYENGNKYTMSKNYTTYARMPIYLSDETKSEVWELKSDNSNEYLYYNLDQEGNAAPYGYWTVSPYSGDTINAWIVSYGGCMSNDGVGYGGVESSHEFGIRPVITLKI